MTEILMTGVSGYVLGNLMDHLLGNGDSKDYVIHATARNETSRARIEAHSTYNPEQVRVIPNCDISKQGLNLNDKIRAHLQENIEIILHGAASTSFHPDEKEQTWNDNVTGTEELLKFARSCKKLKRFIYIGTVFANGKNRIILPEAPLPKMEIPGFNRPYDEFDNPYEWSKWHAEKLVRGYAKEWNYDIETIIGRLGITLGSSFDPTIYDGRMMYQYMALISTALRRIQGIKMKEQILSGKELDLRTLIGKNGLRLMGHNTTLKNFDFSDNANKFLEALLKNGVPIDRNGLGGTYQRINENWIRGYEVGNGLEQALNLNGIRYVGNSISTPTNLEDSIATYVMDFRPYCVNDDPRCVTTQTENLLSGIPMARMTYEAFNNLLRTYAIREIAKHRS
jgi:nucleoside-diphosphate-sugar epimerase